MVASIRDIAFFVATYEERSFTGAASRENATQPGVSQHIRKLEQRLGVTLFLRRSEGVEPTPAADRFYRHCTEVLRAHSRAMNSVEPYSKGTSEEISVGLMFGLSRWALAPALDQFTKEFPNARLRVVEAFSGFLSRQVQVGELDFAIVASSPDTTKLESTMLMRTPEVLVSSKRRHMEPRASVRLAECGPLNVIVPLRGNIRHEILTNYFWANGVHIERLIETDSVQGALALAANTDWTQIVPAVVFREEDLETYNLNPLRDPGIWLDILRIKQARRSTSPAVEAFFEMLMDSLKALNEPWKDR